MSVQDLIALVDRLRALPTETEWFEFKRNYGEAEQIGEYLSALANAACLASQPRGYLVFGIDDDTHAVVGTRFDPYATKSKGNQDLLPWLGAGLRPNTGVDMHLLDHPDGRVVVFEVGPARDQPVSFYGTAWVRVGASKTELSKQPENLGPPFMLAGARLLKCLRNLTVRALPSGILFPQELTQYDPWVIREALHNSIAHQDYRRHARNTVVEFPDRVLVANVGEFLPGSVQTVIEQDSPQRLYRNPFLADAMVEINLSDTQGGGIKRMFETQRRHSFPLPDYDLEQPGQVSVSIPGQILGERYTRLLMEQRSLSLPQMLRLDRVQKGKQITRDEHKRLKTAGARRRALPHRHGVRHDGEGDGRCGSPPSRARLQQEVLSGPDLGAHPGAIANQGSRTKSNWVSVTSEPTAPEHT